MGIYIKEFGLTYGTEDFKNDKILDFIIKNYEFQEKCCKLDIIPTALWEDKENEPLTRCIYFSDIETLIQKKEKNEKKEQEAFQRFIDSSEFEDFVEWWIKYNPKDIFYMFRDIIADSISDPEMRKDYQKELNEFLLRRKGGSFDELIK